MRALLSNGAFLRKPAAVGCAAAFLWAALFALPCWAIAQFHAQPIFAQTHVAQAGHARAYSPPARAAKRPTRPRWTELTPAQQQALAPLAGTWDTVSVAQKRKWLAISRTYPKMSSAEQDKLHSRMTDWVGLSPQQRTQARLNFGQTRQLAPNDKKAKWEAYQALSPEEKRKLAAKAPKAPAAAAAVKPMAPEKLAGASRARHKPHNNTARIAAAPNQVDHNTLLPQPARVPAPVN